jgi:hypothetical protein
LSRHERKESERCKSFAYKELTKRARNGCSSNGRAFHRDLDILTPSRPLSRSLDLPVCLARFPSARLWLKDESLEDSANLLDPDIIAQEIVEDLEAALQQFAAIASDLKSSARQG